MKYLLLFGSFGWGEILIIGFVIAFLVIVFGARTASRRYKSNKTVLHYPAQRPSSNSTSIADELEKLANLRDRGIITDEEFESQKKKLMK